MQIVPPFPRCAGRRRRLAPGENARRSTPSRTFLPANECEAARSASHFQAEPLFADLELHHTFADDLRKAKPESVDRLVVLHMPAALGVAKQPRVPGFAKRIVD